MRSRFAIALALLFCLATAQAAAPEGAEPFVFVGNSLGKTVEFSYYLDVCGHQATGERLRRLTLKKLDTCPLPASEKESLRSDLKALEADMEARMKGCDADADCALGKRQYCPGMAKSAVEFTALMDEAEKDQTALDRLAGGCELGPRE